jgi:ParB family transcriptional regulator, chromosome partitioning protein
MSGSVLDDLRQNRSRTVVEKRTDDLVASTMVGRVEDIDVTQLRSRIAELEKAELTLYVDPLLIDRSPFQPRKYFCPVEQAKLNADVAEWGVLENLIVRVVVPGRYELIAGERRQISAIAANRQAPIKIMDISDRDARRIALSENMNRVDLNPIEETWAILNLLVVELNIDSMDEAKSILYDLNNIAKGNKSNHNVMVSDEQQLIITDVLKANLKGMNLKSFISNRLPLLDLPDDVSDAIMRGLEYTKAVAISKLEDHEQRADLLRCVADEGMPLTEIKKQVKSLKPTPQTKEPTPKDRVNTTLSNVKKLKVWENTEKWARVENLLAQLDEILA